MLSMVSSYLFGEDEIDGGSGNEMELTTTPAHDGEWMLVDRLSRSSSPSETNRSDDGGPSTSHTPSEPSVKSKGASSSTPSSPSTSSRAGPSRGKGLHMTLRQPHQPRAMAHRAAAALTNSSSAGPKPKKQKVQHLSKNNLRRCNKSTHYESGCKKQRRKHHVQHHSGKNNDRKCQ